MIKKISLSKQDNNLYPFSVPSISGIDELDLSNNITIFVGDNGSGKSTLLKALAHNHEAINVSMHSLDDDFYDSIKPLSKALKVTYKERSKKGFFFSGEEFITYISKLEQEKKELLQQIKEVEEEYKDKSVFARNQALSAPSKELHALNTMYDGSLGHRSHGEGFLSFFKARMHSNGIYFLDEPETPLSTINQYQLVVMLTDLVKKGSQIIIATHSPILMALKGACIYQFTDIVEQISYDEIESISFLKHFLNNKDVFIERIDDDDC